MTDDPRDDDTKGPLGQAIDVIVYAPIGLLFEGSTLLPKLVEQGKGHARGARMFGEFAVRQGRAEAKRRLGSVEEQVTGALRTLGVMPDGATGSVPPAAGTRRPGPSGSGRPSGTGGRPTGNSDASASSSVTGDAGVGAGGDGDRAVPGVADLAITDYDSLSASQVVTRLDGLAADELEAVRAYEAAHRGRKTILNKVAQLQA